MGFLAAQVNLVPCVPAPTSLFMALCDGGPPTIIGLGAPDQGADQGPNWPLGQVGGDQPYNIIMVVELPNFRLVSNSFNQDILVFRSRSWTSSSDFHNRI